MDPDPFPTVMQGSISDQVYQILRERILSSHASPGERLNLAEIESQMGVSRTPLQQAINRLSVEGLIRIVPRKGTYVTRPTRKDVEEIFGLRVVLEAYAVQLAVQSMTTAECDALCALVEQMAQVAQPGTGPQAARAYLQLHEQFHQLIVDASHNDHLKRLWMQVNAYVRIARAYTREPGRQLGLTLEEHAEIAGSLAARDGARAQELLEEHIRHAQESVLRCLEALDRPDYAA
jgi:DNA-binding GntR family transcriptional regulator